MGVLRLSGRQNLIFLTPHNEITFHFSTEESKWNVRNVEVYEMKRNRLGLILRWDEYRKEDEGK